MIDIGAGIPTYNCINANAQALARYAALGQENGIVPIVEPEVLMDGDHDIERCEAVTDWVLKEVFQQLYYARVALEGMILKPNMIVPGKKCAKQNFRRGSRRAHREGAEGMRAGRGAGHRLPVRRPVATKTPPRICRDERHRQPALAADLLLWPRPAGRAAERLERQDRECRRRQGAFSPIAR